MIKFKEYCTKTGEQLVYCGTPDLTKLELLVQGPGDLWHSSLDQGFTNAFEDIIYQTAVYWWYLNDFEVYKNEFKLKVPEDWDTVIFTQTAEAKWKNGQGRVDLYIENFKVAEKWFYLDKTKVLLEEKKQQEEETSPHITLILLYT